MTDGTQYHGEEGTLPFGMNRREYLKYFGAGGLASGLAGCTGGGGGEGQEETVTTAPPDEQLPFPLTDEDTPDSWDDITLRWTTDNAAGPLYSMFGHLVEEDTGGSVSFNDGKVLPPDNYYSKLNSEFIGGGDVPYDIALNIPLYLGDFQSRGIFEPLDEYLAQYDQEVIQTYLDEVIEPYREFYMKWDGQIVALPIDGDIHNLFYRPSFFEDSYHQEEYQSQTGKELQVPNTWPEFNEVAKYFTENTEDGVYGTQVYGARPWNFGWWMDRAAARGVVYFDEEMEPAINSEDAVTALENMVEAVEYAPEGTTQFGIAETVNQWQQGNVVMTPWWIDLTEFTARGDFPVVGDQSAAAMPGWEQDDGSVRRNSMMLYNRLYSIPANLDDARKEQAFYAILRLSHPDVSTQATADPFTGLDPNQQPHYTDEAAKMYTEPNPLRETGEGFPKNVPIFSPDTDYVGGGTAMEQAKQHLEAGQVNMENGFPQPNWPGASQYIEDLSIHIQRALTGEESPQEALDNAADKWRDTVEELGKESQKELYQREFLSKAEDLGFV